MLDFSACMGQPVYRLGEESPENCPMTKDLAVLVGKLNVSQQCALEAQRANRTLGSIRHWVRGRIILFCSAL